MNKAKYIAILDDGDIRPYMTVYQDEADLIRDELCDGDKGYLDGYNYSVLVAWRAGASGKTYAERKKSVRDLAIEIQSAFVDCTWSWWIEAELGEIFTRLGKRYGLIEEFRENGII